MMLSEEPSMVDRGPSLAGSFLGALDPVARQRLTAGGIVLDVPAGSIVYRAEDAPRLGVIVNGLVRVFLTSPEGRQLTVRYARAGAVLGAPTAIGGPVDVSVQALTETSVLMLEVAAVRSLAMADARVAWSLAEEVTRRLYEVLEAFSGNVFGSVRQRVARHLLDLAADGQTDTRLVARVNQQAVADAAGTSREVVARALSDFRHATLVESTKDGIVLLDPDRLSAVAASGEL